MIVLPGSVLAAIAASAESAYPRECCGLLIGRDDPDRRIVVSRAVPSPNMAPTDQPDRFEVDPQVRFDLMRSLAEGNDRLVGHYHSHPDHPAVPSATDRAMAFEPDLIWVIAAVARGRSGEVRAWRPITEDPGFREIPVHISGANLE